MVKVISDKGRITLNMQGRPPVILADTVGIVKGVIQSIADHLSPGDDEFKEALSLFMAQKIVDGETCEPEEITGRSIDVDELFRQFREKVKEDED